MVMDNRQLGLVLIGIFSVLFIAALIGIVVLA
jgi:hypothetical protein